MIKTNTDMENMEAQREFLLKVLELTEQYFPHNCDVQSDIIAVELLISAAITRDARLMVSLGADTLEEGYQALGTTLEDSFDMRVQRLRDGTQNLMDEMTQNFYATAPQHVIESRQQVRLRLQSELKQVTKDVIENKSPITFS